MRCITIALLSIIILSTSAFALQVAIGEAFEVGETWWQAQANATVGKTIFRDADHGTHFVFTKGMDAQNSGRLVYYNYSLSDDSATIAHDLSANGNRVNTENRAGYAAIAPLRRDDGDAAVVFYHAGMRPVMAVDWNRAAGAFTSYQYSPPDGLNPITVKGAVDHQGRIHVLSGSHFLNGDPGFPILFGSGVETAPGDWRIGAMAIPDTETYLSHLVTASRTTNKAALVWHHNLAGIPAPAGWGGGLEYQMNADLYCLQSPNGADWDWDNPFNITRTNAPNPEMQPPAAYGDTQRPYADMDAIYIGDVLHVVFSSHGFWADLTGQMAPPVEWVSEEQSFIWHWDSESDSLTLVADGWYLNDGIVGGFDGNVSKPSLGADADGNLYCIFRKVTEADLNPDGYCYGEVALSYSRNGGASWSEAVEVTGTLQQRGDDEPEYVDERFPSLAERVDNYLHLYYMLAPEYATVRLPAEGETIYKMVYQRIPVGDIPDMGALRLPNEGFSYHHTGLAGVDIGGNTPVPSGFVLKDVHPNPFNSQTTIEWSMPVASDAKIAVYDTEGRLIDRLSSGRMSAGDHSVVWDAASKPAGVYLVRLEVNGFAQSRKAVVVK